MTFRPGFFELDDCLGVCECGNEVSILEIGCRTIGEDGREFLAQELLGLPRCALGREAYSLIIATNGLFPLVRSEECLFAELVRKKDRDAPERKTDVSLFLCLVDDLR